MRREMFPRREQPVPGPNLVILGTGAAGRGLMTETDRERTCQRKAHFLTEH